MNDYILHLTKLLYSCFNYSKIGVYIWCKMRKTRTGSLDDRYVGVLTEQPTQCGVSNYWAKLKECLTDE